MQQVTQREASNDRSNAQAVEMEFHRLLEKLPAGAYTCDAEGLITYYNPRAVDLWGRAPRLRHAEDRFCGSFRLFSVDGAPIRHDECWMARALRDNLEYNGCEIVIERPDGRRMTALAHANPVRDENGRLRGAVNVLVDITDQKDAEIALRDAARAKDEFLAILAHELRNPLAPVRNAVEILNLQAKPTAEARWAVQIIDRQVQQMTRLIDDLLDVSRITRNRLELRMTRTDVSEIIEGAVETVRPLLERSAHRLELDLPPQRVTLVADRTRIAQAIGNLLNNAAKFTPHGGRIRIAVQALTQEVRITVSDTGIGIPAAQLPHVFEMFTQIDRTLERTQGGLGIGLTLVKRLVELHGGRVEARSDGPGTGSEFAICLPLVEVQSAEPSEAPPAVEGRRGPLRILVVDDNADAARTLARLLQLLGNEVRTAGDGVGALQMAAEFVPDVAILDIGLPRVNGYDAARAIRAHAWGRQITLIAVTGWGQEADKTRSREAGFDHHLVKPVEPDALLRLLPRTGMGVQSRPAGGP